MSILLSQGILNERHETDQSERVQAQRALDCRPLATSTPHFGDRYLIAIFVRHHSSIFVKQDSNIMARSTNFGTTFIATPKYRSIPSGASTAELQ